MASDDWVSAGSLGAVSETRDNKDVTDIRRQTVISRTTSDSNTLRYVALFQPIPTQQYMRVHAIQATKQTPAVYMQYTLSLFTTKSIYNKWLF